MNDRPALAVAERAADWLIGLRAAERADDLSLSQGTAGVLLFFLHAARAYDEPRDLAQACTAGDVLAAAVRDRRPEVDDDPGGMLFALRELAATTGQARYAAAARAVADRIAAGGAGFATAGTALALLHAGEVELALARARAMAGSPAATAGAAYALAVVGAAAGDADLRAAAAHRAVHLTAGVGPGRVFAALAAEEPSWWAAVDAAARALLDGGIPASPGRDGGSAGVADWMLDLHRAAVAGHPVGDPAELLAFARTLTAGLLDRAVVDAAGARWPDRDGSGRVLPPATGWGRGAAGIGSWLVRLDTFDQGRESALALPGSPW